MLSSRAMRKLALLLLLTVLPACRDSIRELAPAATLSRIPTVLRPEPPLDAPGPQHELCVMVENGDSIPMFQRRAEMRIKTAAGRYVTVSASFVGDDGTRIAPIGPSSAILTGLGEDQVCITPKSPPRRIIRVELSADDTLAVRRITWFSGQHRKLL